LIERKKFCGFVGQWSTVVSAVIELVNEENKFTTNEQYWKQLASATTTLPSTSEELIKSADKERTFFQISNSEGGGANSSYDYDGYGGGNNNSSSGYSAPNSGSFVGSNNSSNSSVNYSSGGSYGQSSGYGNDLGTATALYDFAGEQETDLPFYAGDVITVTIEDDGSGWLTGELNGRSGIFPTSYVRRN